MGLIFSVARTTNGELSLAQKAYSVRRFAIVSLIFSLCDAAWFYSYYYYIQNLQFLLIASYVYIGAGLPCSIVGIRASYNYSLGAARLFFLWCFVRAALGIIVFVQYMQYIERDTLDTVLNIMSIIVRLGAIIVVGSFIKSLRQSRLYQSIQGNDYASSRPVSRHPPAHHAPAQHHQPVYVNVAQNNYNGGQPSAPPYPYPANPAGYNSMAYPAPQPQVYYQQPPPQQPQYAQ